MPNPNLTLVAVILDRSGSMAPLREATITGLNEFLGIQRKASNDVLLHLVQFDHEYAITRDFAPLKEVKDLTQSDYEPRGSTALLDAIGRTITDIGNRLSVMPEATRPGKVLIVTQTDGEENCSREFNQARIKDLITHQREKYSWDFVFLGANIDAFSVASTIGIPGSTTLRYTSNVLNTRALFNVVSTAASNYAAGTTTADSFFSAEDRDNVVAAVDAATVSSSSTAGT